MRQDCTVVGENSADQSAPADRSARRREFWARLSRLSSRRDATRPVVHHQRRPSRRHGLIMELSHRGFSTVNISAVRHVEKCHFVVVRGGGGSIVSGRRAGHTGARAPDEVRHNLSSADVVDDTASMLCFGCCCDGQERRPITAVSSSCHIWCYRARSRLTWS